jgi:hypothetical protein
MTTDIDPIVQILFGKPTHGLYYRFSVTVISCDITVNVHGGSVEYSDNFTASAKKNPSYEGPLRWPSKDGSKSVNILLLARSQEFKARLDVRLGVNHRAG